MAKDYVEAYKWVLLAAGQGYENAKKPMTTLEDMMTREQIAEGQKLARSFKPREVALPRARQSSRRYFTDTPGIFRHRILHHGGRISHYQ